MAATRDHVTNLPRGFITVRILQALFTIAVIPLSLLIHTQYKSFAPPAYTWPSLKVAIAAIITAPLLTWIMLSTYLWPRAYNYWVLLPTEILLAALWVFAFLQASGSGYDPRNTDCRSMWSGDTDQDGDFKLYCPVITNPTLWRVAGNARYPLMGFAGALVVLWFTSFGVVAAFIAKHRRAGRHCKPEC